MLCGLTARRTKDGFGRPVYLYTDDTPALQKSEQENIEQFAAWAARMMKQYEAGQQTGE